MIIPSERHPHRKQIVRLARLSWWLMKNPDVPVERVYISLGCSKYGDKERSKEEAARVMRALRKNGKVDKDITDGDYPTFSLKQEIPGTEIEGAYGGHTTVEYEWGARRDAVCAPVVVGTETVEIPAKPAREAEPARTVTKEIVEYDCPSLLEVEG